MKHNTSFIRKTKALAFILIAFFCFSFTYLHHGWSSYDQKKVLNYKGKIMDYSDDNPHGIIKLEVDNKIWKVVLAPPSRMQSRGLSDDMLKAGTTATVVGYPHLTVKDEMRAERITIGQKTTELR